MPSNLNGTLTHFPKEEFEPEEGSIMSTIYNPKSSKAEEFISHEEILETLAFAD